MPRGEYQAAALVDTGVEEKGGPGEWMKETSMAALADDNTM